MKIGEMFINLGISGADKTVGALTNVKSGLGEVSSMSLEAKAGIIGALYATEQMFAASGKAGTGLVNFNAAFGLSIQTLQKYQYAARQVGLSNEEVEGSFKGLQQAVTKQLMGQGNISGLARVGIKAEDLKAYAQQPELLLQKLQEYAGKESNVGFRNEVLKSFGLNDGMIAALSRKAFRPEVLSHAPAYSDREAKSLDRANIGWSNLGNKIQMAVGHFNAAHGGKLIKDISKVTDEMIKLVTQFQKLSETIGMFQVIGKIFEGWALLLGVTSDSIKGIYDYLNPNTKEEQKEIAGAFGSIDQGMRKEGAQLGDAFAGFGPKPTVGHLISRKDADQLKDAFSTESLAPNQHQAPQNVQNQNVTINQDLHFQHDGKDAVRTGHSLKKAVREGARQLGWPQGT